MKFPCVGDKTQSERDVLTSWLAIDGGRIVRYEWETPVRTTQVRRLQYAKTPCDGDGVSLWVLNASLIPLERQF